MFEACCNFNEVFHQIFCHLTYALILVMLVIKLGKHARHVTRVHYDISSNNLSLSGILYYTWPPTFCVSRTSLAIFSPEEHW